MAEPFVVVRGQRLGDSVLAEVGVQDQVSRPITLSARLLGARMALGKYIRVVAKLRFRNSGKTTLEYSTWT